MATLPPSPFDRARRNRRTFVAMVGVGLAMLGLGFASVPLYRIFCQQTGFNGTTQRADAGVTVQQATGHRLSIRFDSNVQPGMPWQFKPEHPTQTVTVGAKSMAIFVAKNMSDRPVTGTASFNVTPTQAGAYFTKIQCFCFTQQTLQPGQEVRMPVLYYVDPKILADPDNKDTQEITLSYTFYPVEQGGKAS
ncbi:cytochrome c oxidase assembly protein [Sphingobium naphthae]|jgi:cytochrome c oxidase assembly protein subunit 11|uniref:Cytochrome c oxidase assembly protein CtaG n=1 Tax=Sphingobium naphthae TaxID=1886786 RepID=A0ABU3ZY06_9SPHN|nr:cytochrome c oxidase assembly protein [Sphingobium naphthae]MAN12369.1 cytochrome c oxidase assembly protein [Sphingobium sp.]MEC7933946.1 cytochrome c oxidase assembly protein [Pseudomonadota bacterium]PDH65360.1 MAG: cytochrome c oxidase assembly protein [Sphingomonadaceae bacterium MED-G03]MCC4250979.1 cytochrome c oxidase assembly protein [Sphingobium naphthae]MDV5824375.1 cytochrome c oxidase assembly protein [Sphingobium naphthae]|tara:strand:+ start:79 stop:654 length:576 start_codon:yes stop_codon:yes gene_type:complete